MTTWYTTAKPEKPQALNPTSALIRKIINLSQPYTLEPKQHPSLATQEAVIAAMISLADRSPSEYNHAIDAKDILCHNCEEGTLNK